MRPTNTIADNLLDSESTNININLIQNNTFTETSRIMLNQISQYSGLAQLTHKINYHRFVIPYLATLTNLPLMNCHRHCGYGNEDMVPALRKVTV